MRHTVDGTSSIPLIDFKGRQTLYFYYSLFIYGRIYSMINTEHVVHCIVIVRLNIVLIQYF